jgi:uncharacterized protein YutE (UPF0331/DUF86 family)
MVDEKRLMEKLDEIKRSLSKLTAVVALSGKDEKDRVKTLSRIGL